MGVPDLIKKFDFDDFDYFYHETDCYRANSIMNEGLLVEGNNILNTNNIIYTVASPLTENMVEDDEEFNHFLEVERSNSSFRDVSAVVILSSLKEYEKNIVTPFGKYKYDNYYEGIIDKSFIIGYIDLNTKEFHLNDNYEYIENFDYDYEDYGDTSFHM